MQLQNHQLNNLDFICININKYKLNKVIMEKILLDTNYAVVSHDDTLSVGKIVWKGTVTAIEYKNTFLVLLDYAKTHRTDYFLSDTRDQGVIGTDNRKWFEEYALPEAVKLGLKKAAVVMSGNVFKKYYVNMILSTTNRFKLPAKTFSTQEEAMVWLKS